MFDNWATPVVSKRWAFACELLHRVHIRGIAKHYAWHRATGTN